MTIALGIGFPTALSTFGQSLNSSLDIGRNRVGSSSFKGVNVSGESYTLVGAGYDIWDNIDEFHYRYTEFCGDFDVSVRVVSLSANQVWSKAGIMVRESLAEDSRMLFERVTPPAVKVCDPAQGNGVNDVRLAYRTGFHVAGGFNADHNDGQHEDGSGSPNYPNAWLRLTRVGNVFTGYRSDDGVNWSVQGTQDTSTGNWINGAEMRPFSKNVFLGLACSRHSGPTPGCQSATAEFADFKIKPDAKFCFCSADSLGCPKAILLTFSHPVRAGALDRGNYVVSGGISVVSAQAGPKPNQIVLDVSTMAEATLYTARVVAGTVKDSAGDDLDQGCLSASFTHGLSYEAGSVHIVVNQAPFNWAPDYNGGLIGYVFQTRAYDTGLPVATDGQPAHQLNPSYFEDSGPTGVPDLDSIETYFARAIGLLQINADGDYRFSCSSDDGGALFLSTDEKPANKRQIAREPQWAGTRQWVGDAPGTGGDGMRFENVSDPIHLLAGHKYYLEFVHAEGGGGNHGAVTWDAGTGVFGENGSSPLAVDPADPVWQGKGQLVPVRWYRNEIFQNLGPVSIVSQPQDVTVNQAQTATFVAGLDGAPPYTYQWMKNGVAIPGATGRSYTTPPTTPADNGSKYSVHVSNAWGSGDSSDASLTVSLNPILLSCGSRGNCHVIYITYNKEMNLNGAYTVVCTNNVDPTILPTTPTVTSVTHGESDSVVILHVAPDLLPDTNTYCLTINGPTSKDNLPVAPNTSCCLIHGSEYKSFHVLYKRYDGVGNGDINAALVAPKVINDQPDVIERDPPGNNDPNFHGFESRSNQRDNFVDRLIGFYKAPQAGEYRFWMSSDEQGQTYIAEDANPAHKHVIAVEPAWGTVRGWADAGHDNNDTRGTPPIYNPSCNISGNGSVPIPLKQGQIVYLETLHTEGGGGDNSAVTVTINDPNVPPNGVLPIDGSQFLPKRLAPDGTIFANLCDVSCAPVDITVFVGQSATFDAMPDGTPPYTIQWSSPQGVIAGATNRYYTTPPLAEANDGQTYTVTLANRFSSTTCSAVVHVRREPMLVSCSTRNDPNHIYLIFNKPVQINAGETFRIKGPGNPPLVNSAGYGSIHSEVLLSTGEIPLDSSWTLEIMGAMDEENPANTIVPNPTECAFHQGLGRFCTDFNAGLPPCTFATGTTPPYVGGEGALHLTDQNGGGDENYWIIPLGGTATFQNFRARWRTFFNGVGGQDGVSFNVGQDINIGFVPEEGAGNGLSVTVDTFDNGGAEVGVEIKWNGTRIGFTPVGGGNINGPPLLENGVFVDDNVLVTASGMVTFTHGQFFTSAQIPGYMGITANQYVFAARRGHEQAWIDDVCINDYVPGPIATTVSPHAINVKECSFVKFTSTVSGSAPYSYQWYKNDVAIAGANDPTYTTPVLSQADNGATYKLVVTDLFSSGSDSGVVTVPSAPPHAVSAKLNCITLNQVRVTFDVPLTPASANDPSRYSIDRRVSVLSASLQADRQTVFLSTSPMQFTTCYTLTVRDCAGNADTPVLIAGPALAAVNSSGQAMAVVEAEDYDRTEGAATTWAFGNSWGGFSAKGYMEAVPDAGVNVGNGPLLNPGVFLDYCIYFPAAGHYYFWVRGSTGDDTGSGNSVHIALDGANPDSGPGNRIDNSINDWGATCGAPLSWGWVRNSAATSQPSFVNVPTAGLHTFRIWLREDGMKLDQFLLTTDAAFKIAACDAPLTATPASQPWLRINQLPSGKIALKWDPPYRLQCSPALGTNGTVPWKDVVTASPFIVTAPSETKFYRLIAP